MSLDALAKATTQCREAAVQLAWSQWSVLGGQVGGNLTQPHAVVDPEALVLFSCALREDEPRLWDLVGCFLAEAPSLLSVQRTKNLAALFTSRVREILPEVAAIAVEHGKDARWRPLRGPQPRSYRPGKVYQPLRGVVNPPALVLRLRLAFGVHARTDALAFLLAIAPSGASARDVAEATGYGTRPVGRALEAMAASRLVTAEGVRPERYHVMHEHWTSLLADNGQLPEWRYWCQLFAFLAAVLPSTHAAGVREHSTYLESADLRRLVLHHKAAFAKNRIVVPEPSDYPGETFLDGFTETLQAVATWLGNNT